MPMAKGLAVLEAVLQGKRVRLVEDGESSWWIGLEEFQAYSIRSLLTRDWEIEANAPMTFAEAVEAMRAGSVVGRVGDPRWRFRYADGDYEMRKQYEPTGKWGNWNSAIFMTPAVDATDWHVVQESTSYYTNDARPTTEEVVTWLARGTPIAEEEWLHQLRAIAKQFPAMFRPDKEADDVDA